jgi:hypothetical protein
MKPIAWFDPSNGIVSTDRDSPLFTPLGQVWPLYLERTEPVACERCKQLEEQAYDLLGRLQAANLSIAMLKQIAQL